MKNRKDLLLKILEAIGYQDDKDAFVSQFEKNIQLQAIADLVKSLPSNVQDEIKQKIAYASVNPQTALTIIKDKFFESQFQRALESATQDSFARYIQSIQATLSEPQENALIKILEELKQSSVSTDVQTPVSPATSTPMATAK